LLHEHNDTGGESGATVTGDGEKFDDSETTSCDVCLFLEKSVDHEEITSRLKLGVTKTAEGIVSIDVATATTVCDFEEKVRIGFARR
jgi:hypothetical protein